MTDRVNKIDVNAVNDDAQAEAVTPLGYEESRRIHEQMGADFMALLLNEYHMFVTARGIAQDSEQDKLLLEYVNYVCDQWNGMRQ